MHGQDARPTPHSVAILLRPQLQQRKKAFSSAKTSPRKKALHVTRAATAEQAPTSAKAAVERGLEAFAKGDTSEALTMFRKGMSMNPSQDEARAALYNSACCLTKEKQWQAAADAVAEACNNYGLKYSIAVKVILF